MNYPLKLSFKLFALAPQIKVADNAGKILPRLVQNNLL